VSILAFPGAQILDVAGPLEVLSMGNRVGDADRAASAQVKRAVRVPPGQYRRHCRGQPQRGAAVS
jgi:transcriptional regulator GlxA family with amidase domain